MASAGDLLDDRYRLIAVLGDGGVGTVFRAYDETAGRPVAVKIIRAEFAANPDYRERFTRETSAARAVVHPNLVPILDVGTGDDLYVVTRLVAGADLGQRLEMTGRLPLNQTLVIGNQVASALEEIHRAELIHGDVKPGNIILAPVSGSELAYLSDFGIGRDFIAGLKISSVAESLPYRSPELFHEGTGGPNSDVYALACVVHQCLTGHPPFPGPEYREYQQQHESTPPTPVSEQVRELPFELDPVIAEGLAKDPATRPAPVTWMNALQAAADEAAKRLAPPPIPPAADPEPVKSRKTAAAAIAAIATRPSRTRRSKAPSTPADPAPASPPPPTSDMAASEPDEESPPGPPRSRRAVVGWAAAVLVLLAAVAVAGFVIRDATDGNGSDTSSTRPVASPTARPTGGSAPAASLTGAHSDAEAALFRRVATLPLGQCKAYVEPTRPAGETAALNCTPPSSAVDSVVVRQFDTRDRAVADAASRPVAQGAATTFMTCDPNGSPPNTAQVAAWGYWTQDGQQQGYLQCYPRNKAGGRALVWTYDSAAIEMDATKNADSSAAAGSALFEWWDKNIQPSPLETS